MQSTGTIIAATGRRFAAMGISMNTAKATHTNKDSVAVNDYRNMQGDGTFDVRLEATQSPRENQKFEIIPEELLKELRNLYFNSNFVDLKEVLEHIIPLCTDNRELFFLAGSTYRNLKDFKNSMEFFQKALMIAPDDFAVNFEIALLFIDADMYDLAEKTLQVCSEIDPDKFEPYYERSIILCELERFNEAKSAVLNAIKIQPNHPGARERLVLCYNKLAEFSSADRELTKMLSNSLALSEGIGSHKSFKRLCHLHRLTTCMELHNFSEVELSMVETEKFVNKFLTNEELSGEARFHLAITHLRLGNTEEGWKHYFHRFEQPKFPSPKRNFNVPRVKKINELKGKTVLIWREQGFGDEIDFCSLLRSFINISEAKIKLEVDERLVSSLTRSFPEIEVRSPQYDENSLLSLVNDFDYHMPMADIFTLLKPNPNKYLEVKPWLLVDEAKSAEWAQKLDDTKLKIGFAYNSHFKTPKRDKHKHLNFDLFSKLIEQSDHLWVNLDYTWDAALVKSIPQKIRDKIVFPDVDLKNDFEETCAILNNCDLLISPYMAIRSTAGALGIDNLSFVRGAPYHFDLGATFKTGPSYSSPFIPHSKSIHLPDEMEASDFEKALCEFFQNEIVKIDNRI